MLVRREILIAFLGMAAVTYVTRALPFFALRGRKLPRWTETWLSFVAPAVMAALVAPAVLAPDGRLDLSLSNSYLVASVPTLFVALRARNMLLTVMVGAISAFLALRL